MRGKLENELAFIKVDRNIPAYAGKTGRLGGGRHGVSGTSPRMRGKRCCYRRGLGGVRNIPAYAGKTTPKNPMAVAPMEHPRVCGENPLGALAGAGMAGTSPRMRGKHAHHTAKARLSRNIPAYAGKTWWAMGGCTRPPEHPRVCGENIVELGIALGPSGTSPRMRGKLWKTFSTTRSSRNIPAYAGKTMAHDRRRRTIQEHPRVCGENVYLPPWEPPPPGTSPRMRGKLATKIGGLTTGRNIPAYAGKTLGFWSIIRGFPEHPRVCGENVYNHRD